MNAITKVANGKTSNVALNLLANTAGMIASAVAITTAVAVFTPASEAKALELQSVQTRWLELGATYTFTNGQTVRGVSHVDCDLRRFRTGIAETKAEDADWRPFDADSRIAKLCNI